MKTFDLGGDWQIQSADGRYRLTGTVPGSLFADLEKSGSFGAEGLFWRENNRRCTEIADRDFLFRRDFQLSEDFLSAADSGPVWLEADGLDTLAAITINGQAVGTACNMHRRWTFEVGPLLRVGANRIEITFANTLEHCRRELERRKLWFAYEPSPEIAWPGFNMIRKSHCSYGWDWGPIIPDVGIWKDIRLVARGRARISELRITQDHQPTQAGTRVELEVQASLEWQDDVPDRSGIKPVGILHLPDGSRREFAVDQSGHGRVAVEDAQLWWPNGLGGQPLYRVELALRAGDRLVDRQERTIGLRTIMVRREPDEWGESFEFVVNGLPFFARGADYIPEDVALTRVAPDRTERLLRDSARANFNCIRVWGGGVYPSADFWKNCDELGLVVWMDLMYACALYDVSNPEFCANMVEEVRDNLLQVRHHASLGLVCGNNEMEVAFVEWNLPDIPKTKTEYLLQYQHLFPAVVREVCPEVFYWPASPSSGGDFDHPNAPERGDCHFWEVWHGNKDYSEFTKHYFRFMSEFGFESFPSAKTVASFTLPEDRNAFSPVMEDHQRCVGGNGKIMNYVSRYFRYPTGFDAVIQVSQISQAEALRHGIEHWRRNRGRCMGSVYWQLNDNWPVASWSSIDYFGRWKALHYEARRAYAPVLISTVTPEADPQDAAMPRDRPLPQGNGHFPVKPALIDLHLSNESRQAVTGALAWELIGLDGTRIATGNHPLAVGPFASSRQLRLDFTDRVNGRDSPRRTLFCWHALMDDGGELHGFHAFLPYKLLDLQPARLEAQVRLEASAPPGPDDTGLVILLQSDRPALFAAVDHRDYDLVLSDNHVALDASHHRRLVVEQVWRQGQRVSVSAGDLAQGLILQSLVDSYRDPPRG